MNIAILTSGGDSSGMNPAIKAFVEICMQYGNTPFFIYNGLDGMIDNKIQKASYQEVSGIIYKGGTIIKKPGFKKRKS
jgi:6-phosphofructokinase 1